MMGTPWRRGFGALLAAAVAGSVAVAMATTASAAPGNINPDAPRSLTIHKFAQPATTGAVNTNGQSITVPSDWTPLPGVVFSVRPVTHVGGVAVDLTTPGGWDLIAGLTPAAAAGAGVTLGSNVGGPTNGSGVLSVSNPGLALYLVQETAPGPHNIANAVEDFLVSVPMPGATTGTWNYDVHAYPKNALTTASKTADQTGAYGLGDVITWTVNGDVPRIASNKDLTKFNIIDNLPAQVSLDPAAGNVTVTANNGVTFVAGDYTVNSSANLVTVTFNAPGLTKLKAASNQATKTTVSVAIKTVVNSIGTGTIVNGDGTITGTGSARVEVNNSTIPVTASVAWGAARILKHVQGDTSKVLTGGEFQVFTSAADAAAKTNPVGVVQGSPAVDTLTFVTGPDGTVLIEGLKVGDYWLVETKAPAGYIGIDAPVTFTVAAGSVTTPVQINVPNVQHSPFALPNTGSVGMVAMLAAGLALVSTALVVARRRRVA